MASCQVGRQVVVWQHPSCFLQGLSITTEASGRTKCKQVCCLCCANSRDDALNNVKPRGTKMTAVSRPSMTTPNTWQTKVPFALGERRLSASAHTSTAHMKLEAAPGLLRPVYAALTQGERPALDEINDFVLLDAEERRAFENAMANVDQKMMPAIDIDDASSLTTVKEEEEEKDQISTSQGKVKQQRGKDSKQPPIGKVAKAKGRVCWMFAGKQCYGTLLPARETASMCYARTHKGNTKTLTKGGAYWWLLE